MGCMQEYYYRPNLVYPTMIVLAIAMANHRSRRRCWQFELQAPIIIFLIHDDDYRRSPHPRAKALGCYDLTNIIIYNCTTNCFIIVDSLLYYLDLANQPLHILPKKRTISESGML